MKQIALWTVAALFVLGATSCGGSSGTPPEPEPPGPAYPFDTGTAEQAITTDFHGRLPAGGTLVTTEGIRLQIAPMTYVRTRRGTRVVGAVTIGVDDSGGPDALKPSLDGVVRVWVKDGDDLVDAFFEPSLVLEMELGDWSLPGGWTLCTNVANGLRVLGPDPDDLTGPGNAGTTVDLGVVTTNDTGLEQVSVEQAGPLGFLFVTTPPPTALVAITTTTHELPIPGGAGEWPKVYSWKMVCRDTGELVAIGTVDGGMTNGESQTVSYGGNTYTATVVNGGGGRGLSVSSNVSNRFFMEVQLCNEDGSGVSVDGDASGGSNEEADTGGTYAGAIEITIYGWGGGREELEIWDEIDDALGSGQSSVQDRFAKTGADTYTGEGRVFGHSGSTQDLADSLPGDWDVSAGDRTITIRIPCPPQTTATSGFNLLGVSILDPTSSYTQLFPVPLGVLPMDAAMTSNGEWMAVASAGQLDRIELSGPTVHTTSVVGLGGAVAIGPFDERVYALGSAGDLTAFDLETGAVAWSLATLPVFPYNDISVSSDGAYAYASIPTQGQVIEIDLVHQAVGRTLAVPDALRLNVSFSSLSLAVTVSTGGVRVLDLVTETLGPVIPTASLSWDVVWTPYDEFLLVANRGADVVTLVNPLTNGVVTNVLIGPVAVSVSAFRDELGMPYGLAVFEGNPVAMPSPIPPGIAVFPIMDAITIVPDIYTLSDAPAFVRVNGR